MLTPETVHYGYEKQILRERQIVLDAAFAKHPERFVRGIPIVKPLTDAVYINPPLALSTPTRVI